ncbi:MAG: hypothetical protein Q9187_004978 [Circinaria calcarea]
MSNLDNESEHWVTLDVFHQLHCLYNIRKYFHQDYYPFRREYHANGTENKDTIPYEHWDSIRQSLMCSADITPISFHIDKRGSGIFPKLQATHVCRNFDKITEWAKEHFAGNNVRFQFKEGDALLDYYRSNEADIRQNGGSK